ncbi:MAG: hypothetical protein LBV78_26255, partial [Kitasatospora sp.]|nr:hypothetical protein [Kitasatospora sp.]
MSSRRFVTLDQDGTTGGWLHVVVEAPTGVFYQQQYGGHLCRQGRAEGGLDGCGEGERHGEVHPPRV